MASASTNIWVLLGLGLAGIVLMTRKLKKAVREDFGAFVERLRLLPPPPPPPPKAPHPLAGLSFAVSDMFDIEGYVTGFGNPDWARTHEPALQTSPSVSTIVEGGATCVGKTVIDEMGYGIHGVNKHYEATTNPAVPARIPGGSSSGSAVVVAAGIVDFSLGVDTTGGVRIPAACCGILGFRPSHGAVSKVGVLPVSPSLDTVGWFAKDPSILWSVGQVLLRFPYVADSRPRQIIVADDCFQLLKIPKSRMAQVVVKSVEKLFGRQLLSNIILEDYLSSKVPSLKQFANKSRNGELKSSSLRSLAYSMESLQRHEFKVHHEEWMNSTKPVLDSMISTQVQAAGEPAAGTTANFQSVRTEMQSALNALLKNDGILLVPTLADPPPKIGTKDVLSEEHRLRAFSISAIASMSGCCQVTIPFGYHDKCPVSVSFIARQGGDCFLLHVTQSIFATLQREAEMSTKSNVTTDNINKENSAETAKEKGNIAFKEKQWQKAVTCYTEAIKLNGNNATYYSNRAAAYLETGSFLQAEADCSAAINLDKKNVKAYLRRGTAREMLGYYKEAVEDFKYALVLEPTNRTATLALNRMKKLF